MTLNDNQQKWSNRLYAVQLPPNSAVQESGGNVISYYSQGISSRTLILLRTVLAWKNSEKGACISTGDRNMHVYDTVSKNFIVDKFKEAANYDKKLCSSNKQ